METESSSTSSLMESNQINYGVPQLQLRSYQHEMLEESMQKNIIVAMDTGSGKTFIAVSRISAELEKCPADKLVWFLAPNVALAEQQHDVLSKYLPSSPSRLLIGADGVERWSDQNIWDEVLHNIRIVVSTHQVLLDALTHGFVQMTSLALLVFDEAHHCTLKHPANKIMQRFYHPLKKVTGQVPAVLGLTASPVINKKIKGLELIESNMNAISVTPKLHREELLQFVHQPDILMLLYPTKSLSLKKSQVLESLHFHYGNIDIEQDPYIIKLRAASDNDSSRKLRNALPGRKTYCHDYIKSLCCKALDVYSELGSWATDYFIRSCIDRFQNGAIDGYASFDAWDAAETIYLKKFFGRVKVLTSDMECLQEENQVSPKVQRLINFLKEREDPSFTGLVFVQTRAAVAVLAHLISMHPKTKDAFTVSTFVGTSYSVSRKFAIGELVDIKNQRDTLEDLRLGRKNLVIATSALEEGIDVSACNHVICFEKPMNLKSFIQRRGRARQSKSTYAIMFEDKSDLAAMATWQDLEEEMRQNYMDEMRQLQDIQDLEDKEVGYEEFQIESTGAKLTLDDAVQHLYHFCATLPATQYADLRPVFTFSKTHEKAITAKVVLPSSVDASVRTAYSSSERTSEKLARKDAAFVAYIALYQAKLVNDNLLPLRFDEVDEARSTVEKRPSLVAVPAQLDIWSDLVAKEWQEQPKLNESSVLVVTDGVVISQMLMILPVELKGHIDLKLYWDVTKSVTIVIRPMQSVPFGQERLASCAQCTDLLLRSIYQGRMEHGGIDFACLFIPAGVGDLQTWLEGATGSIPAGSLVGSSLNSSQLGLVRDLTRSRMPHIFHGIEAVPSDLEGRSWRGAQATGGESVDVGPYLKVTKLPKRADFLHEIASQACDIAVSTGCKYIYLPASHCEVDKLPTQYSQFAKLIPSIMHQVEIQIAAEQCHLNLLHAIQINDLNMIITATNASVAREQTNYQRLEFLGDSILKLFTSLTLMAEHLNWHEGVLSGKKDHIVSNARLASSALQLGLAQYIRTIPFTGHKWRPLYTSKLLDHRVKKTREISTKTLADVVEALIGASYLDGGSEKGLKCLALFLPEIPWAPLSQQNQTLYSVYDIGVSYPHQFSNLEDLIGYKFNAKALLVEAMTHASHQGPTTSASYQRLEFLGDSVLDNIIVTTAYSHEPPIPTLALHLIRTALVNGFFLAFLCLTHSISIPHFDPVMDQGGNCSTVETPIFQQIWAFMRHASPSIRYAQQGCVARYNSLRDPIAAALHHGQHYPWAELARLEAPKFFSDLIESLIGAIYIDSHGSLGACKDFLERLGMMAYLQRAMSGTVALLHPKEEVGQVADTEKVKYVVTEDMDKQEDAEGRRLSCAVWVGEREVVKVGDGTSVFEVETRAAAAAVVVLKAEGKKKVGTAQAHMQESMMKEEDEDEDEGDVDAEMGLDKTSSEEMELDSVAAVDITERRCMVF